MLASKKARFAAVLIPLLRRRGWEQQGSIAMPSDLPGDLAATHAG